MRTHHSLRFRLALTYAGMALLTAAVLGGVLLGVLGNYYARSEQAYLRAGEARILANAPASQDSAYLDSWVRAAAIATQLRVQVRDSASEAVVADSGPVREIAGAGELTGGEWHHRGDREDMPSPLGGGLFAGPNSAAQKSSRTLTVVLDKAPSKYYESTGRRSLYAVLSEPPASGRDALAGVAQAWLVSALAAIVLGALTGYAVSRRITRPLAALTEASDRMAAGDLSVRAEARGTDEIGRLAASFNSMAARVEATVSALRRFVGDAAHEIGTPLTALQADLELAERAADSETARHLGRALSQARRLGALSQGLLELSRMESAETASEAELVDLVVIVREVADTLASRAEQRGLEFELSIVEGPLAVAAHRSDLVAVVGNLVDNAIKFTPEGGQVALRLTREGAHGRIVVADTGVGIPEAEHENVFSRFHRARNVAAVPGSGLGLAIVRTAVERAGGSVTFESSEKGTVFRVDLPLA